jgi:hypothetical protein
LLLLSCKDDPAQPATCGDTPDFIVIISALDAPLPLDTVVSVAYGGTGVEECRIPNDGKRKVLFCDPSDREGNPVEPVEGQAGETAATAGSGGEGGTGTGRPPHELEALRCELWTDGPATVTVTTELYPEVVEPLTAKKGLCIVESEIVLQHEDGGV